MLRALTRWGCWLVFGLVGCQPAPAIGVLPLALRQLGACPLGVPNTLEISALGDFPGQQVTLPVAQASTAFEQLPRGTLELSVLAETSIGRARGRRVLGFERDADPVLMVPEGYSCPLADVLLRATDGAAVVALPGGGALIAGGSDGPTLASADAELLREGTEIGVPVASGMLLRRAFASASIWRDQVVVAGGTADRRGTAHDTYELFDTHSERFDAARSGKLRRTRMQHAALLSGDELLLVGGRGEASGAVLTSVERIDLGQGVSEELPEASGLREGRAFPTLLRLDSGSVLVLAGQDEEGRVRDSVERFNRALARFELAASDLPTRAEVAVAALPGARVAWLACDYGSGATCELWLLAETPEGLTRSELALPFAELATSGLRELSLLGFGDGRLLLTAADDSDPNSRRRAFEIDPPASTLSRAAATRVPSQLVLLRSGAIAELDREGLSLRAAASSGPYARAQGNLLESQAELLALAAPGIFLREQGGLRALVEQARLDLGELRFAGLTLEVNVEGAGEILLYDGQAEPVRVQLTASEVRVGTCSAPRPASGRVSLTRSGRSLRVDGTGCSTAVPSAALGVGLRLSSGSLLRGLSVTR